MQKVNVGDCVTLNDLNNEIFQVLSQDGDEFNIGKWGTPWEHQLKVHYSILETVKKPTPRNLNGSL